LFDIYRIIQMGKGKKILRDAAPYLAGIMFAGAWWIWIDAHVYTEVQLKKDQVHPPPTIVFYYYIPGIVGTLALIMTNLVDLDYMNPYSWAFDEGISTKVKVWLYASFALSFSSIGAALWVMAAVFLPPHYQGSQWPGIAVMLQNCIIFLASITLLSSRTQKMDEYDELEE